MWYINNSFANHYRTILVIKFSYILLFNTPLIFVVLIFYVSIQIGAAGHSAAIQKSDFYVIAPLSFYYMFLIFQRLRNKLKDTSTWTLITATTLIFCLSGFNAIGFIIFNFNTSLDYIITSILLTITFCSTLVIIDCYKSVKTN